MRIYHTDPKEGTTTQRKAGSGSGPNSPRIEGEMNVLVANREPKFMEVQRLCLTRINNNSGWSIASVEQAVVDVSIIVQVVGRITVNDEFYTVKEWRCAKPKKCSTIWFLDGSQMHNVLEDPFELMLRAECRLQLHPPTGRIPETYGQ